MHTRITIEKPAFGGYGLGFSDGKTIFVWGSIPGEIVDVEITHATSSHAFAKVVSIHQPSPQRIEPSCPNFGLCGGCDYLHMEYEEELRIKKKIIRDSLVRIGKFRSEDIPAIETISSHRFGYRSHADIKFSHSGKAGFYQKESNHVIPFPEKGCVLLAEALSEALRLPDTARVRSCKIAAGADGAVHTSHERNPVIREIENEIVFERSITCFFQANRFLRAKMAEIACEFARMGDKTKFIDVACGVGFFALHLAEIAHSGIGYDISNDNIFWATHNARCNTISNVEFFKADFSSLPAISGKYDALIIDPPRAGLSKKARHSIIFIAPERIVYASCNPATFARDASHFFAHNYSLANINFIDMFPGTQHIEIIGVFEK